MTLPAEAVILAAGRGSRIGDRTEDRPKAVLPIGPRSLSDPTETSFLRRQCETLRELGVEQVTVVIGYRKEVILEELSRWGDWVRTVVNPTPDIKTSGSLHSFQFAANAGFGILDGSRHTLLIDADIVYHPEPLRRLLREPEESAMLICSRYELNLEEVLVFGAADRPEYMGKGLTAELVCGLPCLGEATGIVRFAPRDHSLVRKTMDWMLGDPNAPKGSAYYDGFGPARRATEHEELTQRFMRYGRMRAVCFDERYPFMEVDNPEEYANLRNTVYPALLMMEAAV